MLAWNEEKFKIIEQQRNPAVSGEQSLRQMVFAIGVAVGAYFS